MPQVFIGYAGRCRDRVGDRVSSESRGHGRGSSEGGVSSAGTTGYQRDPFTIWGDSSGGPPCHDGWNVHLRRSVSGIIQNRFPTSNRSSVDTHGSCV